MLTLYSNGIDANLWESGEYFTSEDPQFGQRGLNIGGDGKRGSGGMATALSPSLCLAIFFSLFLHKGVWCNAGHNSNRLTQTSDRLC